MDANTEMAQNLFEADQIYILLTEVGADMIHGYSYPYIGKGEKNRKSLYIFTTEELAKKHAENIPCEILDGIYPIGKLDNKDKFTNLPNTLSIALNLGINYAVLDSTKVFPIEWFFRVNNKNKIEATIMTTRNEAEQLRRGQLKQSQIPMRFNPIHHSKFSNPYFLTDERKNQLCNSIFSTKKITEEQQRDVFMATQTLHENCILLSLLLSHFMPKAQANKNSEEFNYYVGIRAILSSVIWEKLQREEKLFVACDRKTGKIYIHNDSIYILYTDRFKYQGELKYRQLSNTDEIATLIKDNKLKAIVATDGPFAIGVIEAKTII